MTPERRAQMKAALFTSPNVPRIGAVAQREFMTQSGMSFWRRARAERLRALRLRPWWRKVWDGAVYVVTGREP